jgi:putative addiction module component (TIGR02574 family)
MSTTANEVFAAAMTLPAEQRAQIAEQLLDTIGPAQGEIDEAWRIEIEKRMREIREGRVKTFPHDEVMAEARARMAARKAK